MLLKNFVVGDDSHAQFLHHAALLSPHIPLQLCYMLIPLPV